MRRKMRPHATVYKECPGVRYLDDQVSTGSVAIRCSVEAKGEGTVSLSDDHRVMLQVRIEDVLALIDRGLRATEELKKGDPACRNL